MEKTIAYDDCAREKLLSGVTAIAKAVKITLGPSGKNVLIRQKGDRAPFATKDGVTVAGHFSSNDILEKQAIEAIQEVANNADNSAGDGTTTATILAEAIFSLGVKNLNDENNLLDLKKGIDAGTSLIIKRLKDISVPCNTLEKLKEVAMISSNNDEEVSKIVIDAYDVAGKQGVVNIKRSRTHETYLTTIEGMNLPVGYYSPYFITDNANDLVELDKPYIYMTNKKINSVSDNLNALLQVISFHQESLLIICKGMDPSILKMLVGNVVDGNIKVCVCLAPGFGEDQNNTLKDLGIMLGKAPFMENEGIDFESIKIGEEILKRDDQPVKIPKKDDILKYLPQSEAVMANKERLSIKGPFNLSDSEYDQIKKNKEGRADKLRESLENIKTEYEKGIVQTRISRLTDGIAYINIGAITEIEYIEKQHRIQDALYAVKSASEEGVLAGGGTALVHVSAVKPIYENVSFQKGVDIVFEAVLEPFKQILDNVGIKVVNETIDQIQKQYGAGIDARTGDFVKNMIEVGIIDPLKVTRVALENAASVAGMLLTTDCVIVDNSIYENNLYKTSYD